MLDKTELLKKIEDFIDRYNNLYISENRQYEEKIKYVKRINTAIEYINSSIFTIDEYTRRILIKTLKGEIND